MADTTFSVRLPNDLVAQLGTLSASTDRSKNYWVREAVARLVQSELVTVGGIERGAEDIAVGRVVPHNEAMRRIVAIVARVEAEQKAK